MRTSEQPFSSFLRASVLPSTASTLPSVQPPTFVRFLTFLYWVFFTFVNFTLCCNLFFLHRSHRFSSETHALSHCIFDSSYLKKPVGETLSILLPVVLLSVVLEITSILFVLDECRKVLLCCTLRYSHSRLFCALRCCLLLLQFCLLFNHLRSSAFSPFSTWFCHFRNFHTSL